MSNRKPINRLNPTKCPFCGPNSLACGWDGHKPAPVAAPMVVSFRDCLACGRDLFDLTIKRV